MDASILVIDDRVNQPWNGPDPNAAQPDIGGTYHLSFHGQATIGPPWLRIFTVQNQTYDPATNVTNADLVVTHNAYPFFQLLFTNTQNPESPTGAGVSQVQLLQPGYAAGTTQVFTDDFLNALKPFGTLRYLNTTRQRTFGPVSHNDGPLDWSAASAPVGLQQVEGSGEKSGTAWEYMIALANTTNTDMWITVPGTATDDYVTQLAHLIKHGDTVDGVTYAGLNPNLKVYVEYSNEVWGGIYNTAGLQHLRGPGRGRRRRARRSTTTARPTSGSSAGRRYLERTMQFGNLFRNVLGADPASPGSARSSAGRKTTRPSYTQTIPLVPVNLRARQPVLLRDGQRDLLDPNGLLLARRDHQLAGGGGSGHHASMAAVHGRRRLLRPQECLL